ncbi:MAG: hypothetical protein ACYDDF_07925 [Thermoplasmatota archaeon]
MGGAIAQKRDRTRDRWAAMALVACAIGGALLTERAFLSPAFPSGADAGNILYEGRLLLSGQVAQVQYAPIVPILFGATWDASGGQLGWFLAFAKVLPWILMLCAGAAAGALARALGGDSRAQALAFGLVMGDSLLWFDASWGGNAQLLAIGVAVLGVASATARRRPLALSAGLLAVAALINPYPAVLGTIAVLALEAFSAPRRPLRAWLGAVAVGAVAAPLLAIVYLPLFAASKGGSALGELAPATLTEGLVSIAGTFALRAAPTILALGIALATGPRVVKRFVVTVAVPILLLSLLAQFGTTWNVAIRATYFLAALLAGPAAVGVVDAVRSAQAGRARAPRTPSASPATVPAHATLMVALLLIVAGAGVSASEARADVDFYAPLPPAFSSAVQGATGAPPGGVLVTSPQATIDAWWIEGLTLRTIFPAGPPSDYLFSDSLAREKVAASFFGGRAGILTDSSALLTGGCDGSGVTYESLGRFANLALASFPDENTTVTLGPIGGAILSASGGTHWSSSILTDRIEEQKVIAAGNETILLHRAISTNPSGFNVTFSASNTASSLSVTLWAPAGGSFSDASFGASQFQTTVIGEVGQTGSLDVDLASTGAAPVTEVDPAGHWIRVAVLASGPSLTFHIRSSHGASAVGDVDAYARGQGADLAYIRDPAPSVAHRIDSDPALSPRSGAWQPNIQIYTLEASALGPQCRS